MALSAYEIRVIVSAQDHFSSAFRKINNDLRTMSRMQKQAAKDQARLTKELNVNRASRSRALAEARSLKSGTAYKKVMQEQLRIGKQLDAQEVKRTRLLETQRKYQQESAKLAKATEIQARQNYNKARRSAGKLAGDASPAAIKKAADDIKKTRLRYEAAQGASANIKPMKAFHAANLQAIQKEIAATNVLKAANDAQVLSQKASIQERVNAAQKYHVNVMDINKALLDQEATQQRLSRLENMRARAQGIGHIGRVATLAGGIGLATAGGLANYGAQFNRSLTLAATQTPGTEGNGVPAVIRNAQKLQPEIIKMMKEFGLQSDELTKQAYDVYSSIRFTGPAAKQFSDGLNTMRLAAMASVGGLTSLDDATKATVILANQFGESFGQLSMNMDTAFAIVRYGNMTFSQFTSMLTKVGSAAARAGYSLQDVGGIMAFLTKKSGKPDEAATWIDRMLQALQTPEFVKGMRLLHAPIDKDGKLKPLSDVMDQILRLGAANGGRGGIGMQNIIPYITSVGKHGAEGGAGLRSTIQAQRGLTFSLQDIKALKQAQEDVTNDQGEFLRSFNAVYDSAGYKWQRTLAGFKAGALELGIAVLPAMTSLLAYVGKLIDYFSNLSPKTQKWIGMLFVAGSALLFIGGILTSVVSGLVGFGIAIRLATGAAGLGGMLAMLGGLSPKILAMAGNVTTLTAAFWAMTAASKDGRNQVAGFLATGLKGYGSIPGVNKLTEPARKWLLKHGGQDALDEADGKPTNKKVVKKHKDSVNDLMARIKKSSDAAIKAMGKQQKDAYKKASADALNTVLQQTTTVPGAAAASQQAQQVQDATKEVLDQAKEGLKSQYENFKSINEAMFGDIFTGKIAQSGAVNWRKQFGVFMNADEMLSDLKDQVKQFAEVEGDFATLRKRGLSQDYIDQLKGMGSEGVPYIRNLMKATPAQIKEFTALMATKKKDITKATEIDFNVQLDKWMKFGADAALKIAAGMESEEFAAGKRINAIVDRLFTGAAGRIASAQVAAQNAVANGATDTLPLPLPPAKDIANAIVGHVGFNAQNIVNAASGAKGPMLPYVPNNNLLTSQEHKKGSGGRGDGLTQIFNVNGIFLSEEQMMTNAMRKASHKARTARK